MSKFILTVTFMLKLPLSQKPVDRPFKTTLFTVALLPLVLVFVLHAKTYENYLQLVLLFFYLKDDARAINIFLPP